MAKIPKNILDWKWKIINKTMFITVYKGPHKMMKQVDGSGISYWMDGHTSEFNDLSKAVKFYSDFNEDLKPYIKDAKI